MSDAPIAPDTKQTTKRSPYATARRFREQSVHFRKMCEKSRAWPALSDTRHRGGNWKLRFRCIGPGLVAWHSFVASP